MTPLLVDTARHDANVINRALQLSKWLPRNTQIMKWSGFWWARIIWFALCMAFSPSEFHHPQSGKLRDARVCNSMDSVVYTGLEPMIGHYEPDEFPRIWTASAFSPSQWCHTVMVHGIDGKRFIGPVGTNLNFIEILLKHDKFPTRKWV